MKAVILAGGFGTRLRPLTCTCPKPMAKLCGRPVLSYILDLLRANGIDEVVVTAAYMPEQITAFLADSAPKSMQVRTVIEEQPIGTAGSVRAAVGDSTEPILVISGDCICDFDLAEAIRAHRQSGAAATLLCTKVSDPREYGLVQTDADGRVVGFCEKPDWGAVSTDKANTGIYILEPEALRLIPTGKAYDFSKDLFPLLLQKKMPIYAHFATGYWCDIGDLTAYRRCQADMMHGKVRMKLSSVADGIFALEELPAGDYQLIPPIYIGRNVHIGDGASIGPNSVIGDGCVIGEQAKVKESVLLENVALRERTTVNSAVLCENVTLQFGAKVYENSAVGAGCVIGAHTRIGPNVRIWPKKTVESGMHVSGNIKYGSAKPEAFSDDGIFSLHGADLDPITVAAVGRGIASCACGKKVGVATDGSHAARAVSQVLSGSMAAQGSSVWAFGDCFCAQMYFFTAFCSLQTGIYISERGGRVRLQLTAAGGLPLSRGAEREIESRLQNSDYCRIAPNTCKEISDMKSMESMYLRELIREAGTPLHNQSVNIRCPNEKINLLMEDCLYRLDARTGDELTFKINREGTSVSAFHRDCGWIPFDKLLTVCCRAEFDAGHDVALGVDAPYAITILAGAKGRHVMRYCRTPADDSDRDARELALGQLYVRDALFLCIRLLGILQKSGKTLPQLLRELPAFSVRRRTVPIDFPPTELLTVLDSADATPQKEGVELQMPNGRVFLLPQKSGKRLQIFAEAQSYEISRELCGEIEERLTKH